MGLQSFSGEGTSTKTNRWYLVQQSPIAENFTKANTETLICDLMAAKGQPGHTTSSDKYVIEN